MPAQPQLLETLEVLLTTGEWKAALLTARHLVSHLESRANARRALGLVRAASESRPDTAEWQEVMAWLTLQAGEMGDLARQLVELAPDAVPGIRAAYAFNQHDWTEVLRLWQTYQARGETDGWAPDRQTLARFRARAMVAKEVSGWQAAFEEAFSAGTQPRERGLLLLDFGHSLSQCGEDWRAREMFQQASALLGRDTEFLRLCHANLGIVCLRLGDVNAAEAALRQALKLAGDDDHYLSTAWRGLGGLYVYRQQWPKAAHAYSRALGHARDTRQTVATVRSMARLHRLQGQHDLSCTLLHGALAQLSEPTRPHPIYADLAEGMLLQGNTSGARQALAQTAEHQRSDRWRADVLQAELARRSGQQSGLDPDMRDPWWQIQAWLFPELIRWRGATPAPWQIEVRGDGALRAYDSGYPLALAPNHTALRLLAYLIHCGGSAGTERLLEDLCIAGTTLRLRKQNVSRVVRQLRGALGWPEAVVVAGRVITLSAEARWHLHYPASPHADTFCEGCYDPWILEWRHERL